MIHLMSIRVMWVTMDKPWEQIRGSRLFRISSTKCKEVSVRLEGRSTLRETDLFEAERVVEGGP